MFVMAGRYPNQRSVLPSHTAAAARPPEIGAAHVGRDTDSLWDDYRAQMPLLTVPYVGVMDALADLRADGWRLAVVTNGRVDNQMGKLRRSGILHLLDGFCVSEEIGIRKPVSHGRSWPAGDLPPDQTAETPAAALALLGTMA